MNVLHWELLQRQLQLYFEPIMTKTLWLDDIMIMDLEDFFTHEKVDKTRKECGEMGALTLLYGPSKSEKTSLLFQYAFTQVIKRHSVLLVRFRSTTFGAHPLLITPCACCTKPIQTGRDRWTWQQVSIKYLQNCAELQQFLCSLHLLNEPISVLLIDHLHDFLE